MAHVIDGIALRDDIWHMQSYGTAKSPENFADPPAALDVALGLAEAEKGDLLSELLRTVHLEGHHILDCAPAVPFALTCPDHYGALYIIEQGRFQLRLDGEDDTLDVRRGDVILLPRGRKHTIRYGDAAPRALAPADLNPPNGAQDSEVRWLCGTFLLDDSFGSRALADLPPVIVLRGLRGTSLQWLDLSCWLLMQEVTTPSQGSAVMISRILDLLFIQILRAWAAGPDADPGWLPGAMDAQIGKAVTAIHTDPAADWNVQKLAGLTNLSRSAFADRFTRLVGRPPASYIAEKRLDAAATLLRTTAHPLRTIAAQVGYTSEAAFSRAFHRRFGTPPSHWRRTHQHG